MSFIAKENPIQFLTFSILVPFEAEHSWVFVFQDTGTVDKQNCSFGEHLPVWFCLMFPQTGILRLGNLEGSELPTEKA